MAKAIRQSLTSGPCALARWSSFRETPFGKPADHAGSTAPILERVGRYKDFSELTGLLESSPRWGSRIAETKDFVRRLLG